MGLTINVTLKTLAIANRKLHAYVFSLYKQVIIPWYRKAYHIKYRYEEL